MTWSEQVLALQSWILKRVTLAGSRDLALPQSFAEIISTCGLWVHGEAARAVVLIHEHGDIRYETLQQKLDQHRSSADAHCLAHRNQRLSGISHSEPNQAREGVNKKRRQLLYLSMMEPAYTLLSLIDQPKVQN